MAAPFVVDLGVGVAGAGDGDVGAGGVVGTPGPGGVFIREPDWVFGILEFAGFGGGSNRSPGGNWIEVSDPAVFSNSGFEFYGLAWRWHLVGHAGGDASVDVGHEEVELGINAVVEAVGRCSATEVGRWVWVFLVGANSRAKIIFGDFPGKGEGDVLSEFGVLAKAIGEGVAPGKYSFRCSLVQIVAKS